MGIDRGGELPVDFLSVIRARHSKRAFDGKEVPPEVLEEVLRTAAHAPSSRNTATWHVEVLTGQALRDLVDRLCSAFDAGVAPSHDYVNRARSLTPAQEERAVLAGGGLHEAKGISRDDQTGRKQHQRDNLRFYGATAGMVFHLPGDAEAGSFLDMGLFLQNVMLGLVCLGLGSCPQYSVAGYAGTIRDHLGLASDRLIVCGLSVGYPDPEARVNSFIPARAPLEEYSTWRS